MSRDIHLNPVRADLVRRPEQWEWSSYPGLRGARRVQAWVAHGRTAEGHLGRSGEARRAIGIRRLCGIGAWTIPLPPPFRDACGGWVLGSERFLARLRCLAGSFQSDSPVAEARQLSGIEPKRILVPVRSFYGLDDAVLSRRHDSHGGGGVRRPGSAAGTARCHEASSPCGWDSRVRHGTFRMRPAARQCAGVKLTVLPARAQIRTLDRLRQA